MTVGFSSRGNAVLSCVCLRVSASVYVCVCVCVCVYVFVCGAELPTLLLL